MRATRAYIASAGTAAVLLAASVAMLVLVGGFVAFGSWPGTSAHTALDQVVLRDAADRKVKSVRVRRDAVAVARRAERQRRGTSGGSRVGTRAGTPVTVAPRGSTPQAPAAGGPTAPAPAPAGAVPVPVQPAPQPVQEVTRDVGTQVQQGVQNVQNQVNEVVGGVVAPESTVGETVGGVTDTAGSLLDR